MLNFREFLLNELFGDENDIKKRLIRGYEIQFHISDNGEIIPGIGDYGDALYYISPQYHSVQVQNGDPHNSEFKKVINYFKKFIPDIDSWKVDVVNLSHHKTPATSYKNRERSVSKYLKSIYSDIPKYLYHGTSTELWHEGIKKNGLLPRLSTTAGRFGSYGRSIALSKGDRVYLSNDPDSAARGAGEQASREHGGYPLILRIDTSGLFPEKFGQDEDSDLAYNKKERKISPLKFSLKHMGTLGYAGKIPPSLIKPISLAKPVQDEKKGFYWKWQPFDPNIEKTEHAVTQKLRKEDLYELERSPNYYALVDAGILEPVYGKYPEIKEIDDSKIRKAIRNSADWAMDAHKIAEDFKDFGMKGLKSLNNYQVSEIPENFKPYLNMLINSELYSVKNDWLSKAWYPDVVKFIKLAKLLRKNDKHYEDMIEAIKTINQ